MKLSKLKQKVDKALDRLGDMDVQILLNRTEDCSECGQPKDKGCESDNVMAAPIGDGKGVYTFWIDGNVI